MTRRYYAPDLLTQQPLVELPSEEATHAARVMRVQVDDEVELFDGKGNQAVATVNFVDRRQCVCRSEKPEVVDREPSVYLELAIALPKPDRAKEMIERLTELGVARVQPLVCERTQRPPADSLLGKLERIVIESCKQSGRNQLMSIAPVMKFRKWIESGSSLQAEGIAQTEKSIGEEDSREEDSPGESGEPQWDVRLIAMPGGESLVDLMAGLKEPSRQNSWGRVKVQCAIGPEGGFSDEELSACVDAGMSSIDLGKRILRVETAACVIASRLLED
ncbi:MAG: RsmE family RNA methyltransferase [Rhodopirellula sp. JB044]|uniref:RsmE family RNA methyltransferase n=1 Tax=Rhodopirellula sp. JB044 TaxID=3342844 RepID=UPI003709D02B